MIESSLQQNGPINNKKGKRRIFELKNNFLLIIVCVSLITILSMNVVTFSYFTETFVMLVFLLNP